MFYRTYATRRLQENEQNLAGFIITEYNLNNIKWHLVAGRVEKLTEINCRYISMGGLEATEMIYRSNALNMWLMKRFKYNENKSDAYTKNQRVEI